jgi:propanol-preferring alcohol dehydrogenase
MRAMQIQIPGEIFSSPLKMDHREIPEPKPGEVLIQVSYCGVCRTDLHIVENELPAPAFPLIPGHQIVGKVVACGEGVPKERIGKRIGMPWLYSTCGRCSACINGMENLCQSARFTGFHHDGGYAEYFIALADFVLPMPENIPDHLAVPLLCAGIIGYRSLHCADLHPGERIGLVGFGASAHLSIQVAKYWGCEVSVFTRSEAHRNFARDLGADWVGGIESVAAPLLDRAVIFAPVGELVPMVLEKIRPGGTLAINAVYMSQLPAMDYALLYGERTVRTVANATRQDGYEFLSLAEKAEIRPTVQIYSLEDANQALQDLKTSKLCGEAILAIGH